MSSTKRTKSRWAILDCNSFYASCERLFRPHLRGRPVVVLSNNDGCMISVSTEAKALGLKLGDPVHLNRELIRKHRVEVFSSNYPLYGDLSRRVMRILDELHPDVLQYSIDEAFINFSHVPEGEEESWAIEVCRQVTRETGIPVTIGIGATKTLAKLASRYAKKRGRCAFYLRDDDAVDILPLISVADVWGVGHQSALKLHAIGIKSAWDFRQFTNDHLIRALLSVTGERLRDELRGISCVEPAEMSVKKMISSTRSFGRKVFDRRELEEAVSTYVGFACEKLRAQDSVARGIQVYLRTGVFEEKSAYHRSDGQKFLPLASSDTGAFTRLAIQIVREIYRSGTPYKKAGVLLFDLSDRQGQQVDLFHQEDERSAPLMNAMDAINHKWGRGTIQMASCGTSKDWRMLCEHRSNKTQLDWKDLVEVRRERTT